MEPLPSSPAKGREGHWLVNLGRYSVTSFLYFCSYFGDTVRYANVHHLTPPRRNSITVEPRQGQRMPASTSPYQHSNTRRS